MSDAERYEAVCPQCGVAGRIAEVDIIIGLAALDGFEKDGTPIYAGYTDVDWDSQETVRRKPWLCEACDHRFGNRHLKLRPVEAE